MKVWHLGGRASPSNRRQAPRGGKGNGPLITYEQKGKEKGAFLSSRGRKIPSSPLIEKREKRGIR